MERKLIRPHHNKTGEEFLLDNEELAGLFAADTDGEYHDMAKIRMERGIKNYCPRLTLLFPLKNAKMGKTGKLRTLTFSYNSNEGGQNFTQQVSIPLLTLIPLPLLQVQEADFDLDIQIIDAVTEEKERNFSLVRGDIENTDEEDKEPDLKLRASLASRQRERNTIASVNQGLTANMKVHV